MEKRELVARLKKLDTTCVSDAMDSLGINGCLLGIKPVLKGSKICGPAFTAHYVPCGQTKGAVGGFIEKVKEGEIIVIDNAGRTSYSVWGDIMSLTAKLNKIQGTLIDGACRDVPAIIRTNYPVFSKDSCMVSARGRAELDSIEIPVSISDIQIRPGDIILADDDGAIAIPQARAEEVLRIAEELQSNEGKVLSLIATGHSLSEVYLK